MRCNIGKRIEFEIIGKSHDKKITTRITGIPIGTKINLKELQAWVNLRKIRNKYNTKRNEEDLLEIESGLQNFAEDIYQVNASDIYISVYNNDIREDDYTIFNDIPRPSHSDISSINRYGKVFSGGGEFSGRLTIAMVIFGGIAKEILAREYDIEVFSHIKSIKDIEDISILENQDIKFKDFPYITESVYKEFINKLEEAINDEDSLGGTIEFLGKNIPKGLGGVFFERLEAKIASLIFSIPGIKGLSFGSGFEGSRKTGFENNDTFSVDRDNNIITDTNNHGGILGGISTGMDIWGTVSVKPTSSIARPQKTLNIKSGNLEDLSIKGRHDVAIVLRAWIVIESVILISLLDEIMEFKTEIEDLRSQIDVIDSKIFKLLEERLKIAKSIAKSKKSENRAIVDNSRETKIINRIQSMYNIENEDIEKIYNEILSISKKVQHEEIN